MGELPTDRFEPSLVEEEKDGLWFLHDPRAREAGILVAFSGRAGGASPSPVDSLNLSVKAGDEAGIVDSNRAAAAEAIGFDAGSLALVDQVHGARVVDIAAPLAGGERADGMVTTTAGIVLGILTADCAPVALAGRGGVAIAHAGWRGLAAGVVGNALAALEGPAAAWIGPCIRSCCYEVGEDVVGAFRAAGLPVADDRHVDMAEAAEAALRAAGVTSVAVSGLCTSCEEDRLFSYRRDGRTGRQGGFVSLVDARG
jgi:YfiH family protein